MSDDASTTGASEGDQGAAGAATTGASADGGAGGTQAVAESQAAFAAEREKLQATNRELQAAKDREAARARDLQAKLDAANGSTSSTEAPVGLTSVDLMRVLEVRDLRDSLKTEFADADPNLFRADPLSFESAEAYRLAVARSHEARKAEREALRAEVDAEVRAKYAAVHGELPEAPPAGGEAVTGDPTPAQLAAMSWAERDRLRAADPELFDRVLKKAQPDSLVSTGRLVN